MIEYLSVEEVITIHDALIVEFGGLHGIRDKSLLESAVANPTTSVFGQEMYPSVFDKAACYLFSISRNHPFLDGNKRTASLSCLIFLRQNGRDPIYDEDTFIEFVVSIAEGNLGKEEISAYLKSLCI